MKRILAGALAAVLLLACGDGSESKPRGRVLLIGIDGATPRVTGPLQREGRLPTLSRLAREGASGPLRSVPPLISPPLWTSIATGKLRAKHGIDNFAHKSEDGVQRLLDSTDRKSHALWNIASDRGLRVAVVNWWNTFPPERINGVMVSDHVVPSEIEGRIKMTKAAAEAPAPILYPPEWETRVAQILTDGVPLTDRVNPFHAEAELPSWVKRVNRKGLARRFAEDDAIARIALTIEAETRPDLLMVFLPGIDRISHSLWGVLEPAEEYPKYLQPTPETRKVGQDALYGYYEYTDALIEKLIEPYGENDLVLVVSDHGFEAGVGLIFLTGTHNSQKALHGVLYARGPGIPAGTQATDTSINDITPTILAWLGLPRANDMDGKPASFLQNVPEKSIATYDTTPIERITGDASGAEDTILEQLRALGYIE